MKIIIELTDAEILNKDAKLQKFWLDQFVRERVHANIENVRRLDWFDVSQLLGDESWDFLGSRGLQGRARTSFRKMIKQGLTPIRDVTKHSKDTKRYQVKN